MTKDVWILVLGLLVAATPFLGFPISIENIIFVIAGLAIAILAFLVRGESDFFSIERSSDTFVENSNPKRAVVSDGISVEGEDEHGEERQAN